MSFVSNARTRKTKRACTHHTTFKSVLSSTGAAPIDDTRFNRGPQSAVRNQTAETTTIGSHNSRGLTIIGDAMTDSFQYAPNPYNNPVGDFDVSVGDDHSLPRPKRPNFPITYSGPGHLAFQSGFSVPYIEGNTEIKGDLIVHGSLVVTNVLGPGTAPFTPVIEDELGGTLTGVTVVSSYKLIDFGDYFECCITWTGSNLVSGSDVRLTGFPLTNYSNLSFGTVHVDYGIVPFGIGAQIECRATTGDDYLSFFEADLTTNAPNVNLIGETFASAGKVCVRGLLTKV